MSLGSKWFFALVQTISASRKDVQRKHAKEKRLECERVALTVHRGGNGHGTRRAGVDVAKSERQGLQRVGTGGILKHEAKAQ
jgi:hypothetical protein